MTISSAQLLVVSKPERFSPGVIMSNVSVPRDPGVRCPFTLIEFSVEPNSASEPHAHESAEIWYITRGRGRVLTPEGQINVKEGDVVYLRPKTVHQIENASDELFTALSACWTSGA